MPRKTPALARLALLAATVVWGTSFAIIQRALADLPVFHLLTFRFSLATLLLLPLAARRAGAVRARTADGALRGSFISCGSSQLRDGLVLGCFLFAGFAMQTLGLLWTTPSRSAFLTSLAVVVVPPLAWLAGAVSRPRGPGGLSPRLGPIAGAGAGAAGSAGLRPRLGPIAGALCAAAGLYVLYRPAASANAGAAGAAAAGASWTFGRGDAVTLAGTLAYACHIVVIERVLRRQAAQPAADASGAPPGSLVALAMVQFAVVAALSAPSLVIAPPRAVELTSFALFAIGLSGVAGTAFAFLCQLYAQRHLGAAEAAVLLTFEPVVAALFSVAIGREPWTSSLAAGGALILAAMLLSELGGGKDAVPPAIAAPSS
jgi:drug/metabolite transporter (DMT)-like permease